MQIENIDIQIARAVLHFCQICLWRSRIIHMSDSDNFFRCHQTDKMSINKLSQRMLDPIIFCEKMWALKKWCVTKVAHCTTKKTKCEY